MAYAPAGTYFFVLHEHSSYGSFEERLAQYPSIRPLEGPDAKTFAWALGIFLARVEENTILADERHRLSVLGLEDLVERIEVGGDD